MAGVQRGGRGEVECEREVRRELNASKKRVEHDDSAIVTSPCLPFVRRPRRLDNRVKWITLWLNLFKLKKCQFQGLFDHINETNFTSQL